ncbi:MAG: hypothetical protein Q8891_06920 [Bacteroidota bacterium]|nr:hypothetical protein [Bacteroidota bacterium]
MKQLSGIVKQIFTLSFLLLLRFTSFAQELAPKQYSSRLPHSNNKLRGVNFNGQWRGQFNEVTNGYSGFGENTIVYVLELNTNGSRVSGYSYTYFTEGAKKYYTICRLSGSLNRETNDLVVTEVERTKFNTPPGFVNCFQTHHLHYEKDSADLEVLRGTWEPAPNQGVGCGNGITVLSRRILSSLPLGISSPNHKNITKSHPRETEHKNPVAVAPKRSAPAIAPKAVETKPGIEKNQISLEEPPIQKNTIPEIKNSNILSVNSPKFEPRRKNIIKTITIEQPTFHLDFYDNGEIDGDSISVFYNGKVVLSHKRLSDKPISLTLTLDKDAKENIVTMYADNLGTLPPNTALMVVTDGNKRYEVRIESDLGKSGSVIFEHDNK